MGENLELGAIAATVVRELGDPRRAIVRELGDQRRAIAAAVELADVVLLVELELATSSG